MPWKHDLFYFYKSIREYSLQTLRRKISVITSLGARVFHANILTEIQLSIPR